MLFDLIFFMLTFCNLTSTGLSLYCLYTILKNSQSYLRVEIQDENLINKVESEGEEEDSKEDNQEDCEDEKMSEELEKWITMNNIKTFLPYTYKRLFENPDIDNLTLQIKSGSKIINSIDFIRGKSVFNVPVDSTLKKSLEEENIEKIQLDKDKSDGENIHREKEELDVSKLADKGLQGIRGLIDFINNVPELAKVLPPEKINLLRNQFSTMENKMCDIIDTGDFTDAEKILNQSEETLNSLLESNEIKEKINRFSQIFLNKPEVD